ncbi:MAG: type II toxin-antitoxin system RelE/ParE family toxin [Thermoanaerobaculia bacterium]
MIRAAWHPLAKRELFEAQDFYENRAAGLGASFLERIETAVLLIRRHPQSGSLAGDSLRQSRVRQFPYSLVYRVDEERIFILAVAHDKRKPHYWARRA